MSGGAVDIRDTLLDRLERSIEAGHSEAALRAIKALCAARGTVERARRHRHEAIQLLADLSELKRHPSPDDATERGTINRRTLDLISEIRDLPAEFFENIQIEQATSALDAAERDAAADAQAESIFISYRRDDSADAAGRVCDRLREQFGLRGIFLDVDSIPLSVDFRVRVTQVISQCKACIVIIGAQWLTLTGRSGVRRIDEAKDPVRIEIETALRIPVPVVPILVGGARMPVEEDLPESIAQLHAMNGQPIRPNPDFDNDMQRLLRRLNEILTAQSPRTDR